MGWELELVAKEECERSIEGFRDHRQLEWGAPPTHLSAEFAITNMSIAGNHRSG